MILTSKGKIVLYTMLRTIKQLKWFKCVELRFIQGTIVDIADRSRHKAPH